MDDPQYLIRKGGITYELDDITAQPDDLERLLGRITCTAETSARLMRDAKNTGGWWGAENTAKNFDIIAKQTDDLRAALAAMPQQAPVADDVRDISDYSEAEIKEAVDRIMVASVPPSLREPSVVYDVKMPPMAGTQPQPDAAEAVEQLQHVAYFDEGQFHWMSGIAPRDCELYARPIRAGGQP